MSDIESFIHREDCKAAFNAMCSRRAASPWHRIDTTRKKRVRLAAFSALLNSLEVELESRTSAYNPGVIERLDELSK